jgi:hypothetical protein
VVREQRPVRIPPIVALGAAAVVLSSLGASPASAQLLRFVGTGVETLTRCQNPANNGTFAASVSVVVAVGAGGTAFAAELVALLPGPLSETIAFSGTARAGSASAVDLSGAFLGEFLGNGTLVARGDGSFVGRVFDDSLTLTFSGTLTLFETCATSLTVSASAAENTLHAAVLPGSRSVTVLGTATVFASITNAGGSGAVGCRILPFSPPDPALLVVFSFQPTDPATNRVTGEPDIPVDIPAGATRTFVLSFSPLAAFEPTEIRLAFVCANTVRAAIGAGINTVTLAASNTPIPDVVALVATASNDGILAIPGAAGAAAFAVASVNLGAASAITVSADTGAVPLPLGLSVCQTNPLTGACLAPPGPSVTTQIGANATPTFAVVAGAQGAIAFAPESRRIFVRFRDAGGVTRGATSVAVRTR